MTKTNVEPLCDFSQTHPSFSRIRKTRTQVDLLKEVSLFIKENSGNGRIEGSLGGPLDHKV